MQISIIDHGPVGAKVTISVNGQPIAFPEHSFRQLTDLMSLLSQSPVLHFVEKRKGEVDLTLDLNDSQAWQLERESLLKRIEILTDDNKRIDFLLKSAVQERQNYFSAPCWKRVMLALKLMR